MSGKLLIFVVAYNHEKTIQNVLSRIPKALGQFEPEVLVIDDASGDDTFEQSRTVARNKELPFKLTVLRNPVNQGYGGNQKIGFHYAMKKDFDVVALLHGDGQYAPEKLLELVNPVLEGEADAVFGSRMMEPGGALKGGMPFYKFVGNKVLTFIQNKTLNSSLSEFHSGYRVYKVDALRHIPFHLNTNEFHFDTEIIIQFLLAEKKILELPIPTYYGDEICYVEGFKYAKDVLRVTFLAPFQKMGLFYQLNYDVVPEPQKSSPYQSKLNIDSSHSMAAKMVKKKSKVLDVGCGPGVMASALKDKKCCVTGYDTLKPENKHEMVSFKRVNLDGEAFSENLDSYNFILLLDIVEHLKSPEAFVESLYAKIKNGENMELIATTGNVAFFPVRVMLLLGSFNYGSRGILDLDHKRLFTFSSFSALFGGRGFQIEEVKGVPVPFGLVIGNRWMAKTLSTLNRILIFFSKSLFSYQILLRLKPRPTLDHLLKQARRSAK